MTTEFSPTMSDEPVGRHPDGELCLNPECDGRDEGALMPDKSVEHRPTLTKGMPGFKVEPQPDIDALKEQFKHEDLNIAKDRALLATMHIDQVTKQATITELEGTIERLKEYAEHSEGCLFRRWGKGLRGGSSCSCGLEALEATSQGEGKDGD